MVDCGKGVGTMDGSDGSDVLIIPKFIHNFGLELRTRYPYVGWGLQCPYGQGCDMKRMGYIRTRKTWSKPPSLSERHPLDTVRCTSPLRQHSATDDYSGGKHDGTDCADLPDYVMVVVGHGREDGQQFWPIRSSYDSSWGEQGY